MKQKTVRMEEFIDKPLLGRCYDNNTVESINDLTGSQDSLLNNLKFFLETQDHYKMTRDANLLQLLSKMISLKPEERPSPADILTDPFIKKWART